MPKYLIHASPSRMWYVTDYLIPSMMDQGIDRDDISIWNDEKGLGNLKSTFSSFASVEKNGGGVWHIQDDVVISKDFANRTTDLDSGLVCGYCYDTEKEENTGVTGYTTPEHMWFSFPCIRIPNGLARDAGEWFFKNVIPNGLFIDQVATNKGDDTLFNQYVKDHRADEFIYNCSPTLVAHIDFLIGGSIVNPDRADVKRGINLYFREPEVIEELKKKLIRDKKLVVSNG